MKNKIDVTFIFIVFAFVIVVGCSGDKDSIPQNSKLYVDHFAEEEGKRLYGHYCSPCHGEGGKGDGTYFASSLEPRPADFTNREFMSTRPDKHLFKVISGGSVSIGRSNFCPPWRFTINDIEIQYLVTYIKGFSGL